MVTSLNLMHVILMGKNLKMSAIGAIELDNLDTENIDVSYKFIRLSLFVSAFLRNE